MASCAFGFGAPTTDKEHLVKAGFIANFVKFIEWPDLGRPGSKFVVGVYGADSFERSIEEVFAGKSISGHQIVVEQIHSDAEIHRCKVVISGSANEDRIEKLASICSESNTVLIGEADGFAKMGGTIGLLLVSSHVRFEVNLDSARRQHVLISSKLLSLAQNVYR